MKETTKKIGIGVFVALLLCLVAYEAIGAVGSPQLIPTKKYGEGKPGHGMKAEMMAQQRAENSAKTKP
jgi:hypothetical protein